jgi:hypothetical protein
MKTFSIVLVVLLSLLVSCVPVTKAALTGTDDGAVISFENTLETTSTFALIVLGESLDSEDLRCSVTDKGNLACDLGVLDSGESVLVQVSGSSISCDVYSYPAIRIFPCEIKDND